MKKSKILTILMVLVLMFSLVACSTTKNNDKSQSNNTADISNLMESEPSNLDDATALYQKLMQKENIIFAKFAYQRPEKKAENYLNSLDKQV